MRLPSGDVATPWLASIPLISPTTLLVAGSMMWMLSPAELVWMMRSFPCWAAAEENDKVHRTIAARVAKPQRNTRSFFIVISHVQRQQTLSAAHAGRQFVHQETFLDRYFAPDAKALSVIQSGSNCEANCWPPP